MIQSFLFVNVEFTDFVESSVFIVNVHFFPSGHAGHACLVRDRFKCDVSVLNVSDPGERCFCVGRISSTSSPTTRTQSSVRSVRYAAVPAVCRPSADGPTGLMMFVSLRRRRTPAF